VLAAAHVLRANWRTIAVAAAYSLSAACCCLPLVSGVHLVDLHVYRMGGDAVLHGMNLYSLRYAGQLPFTYPPFAALVFTGLAWLSWVAAAVLLTALTVLALPVMFYLALRLPLSPSPSPSASPSASSFSPPPPPTSGTSPSCGPGGSARPRTPRTRACSAR